MTLNSINTNVAALRAQENIGMANRASSSSIARLSSGERIVRAADDVASMSAGTSLRTNVTTLRTALINTAQGSSMLQVADGALNEITDILLRQKAIAVQAGAGSLSASERAFLDQEFQNLTAEIDRLAGQTNFNGVNLLDGSVLSSNTVDSADYESKKAIARIQIDGAIADTETLTINGVQITATAGTTVTPEGTTFLPGATAAASAGNLLDFLQNSTNAQLSAFNYALDGANTIVVTAPAGGTVGQKFNIVEAGANVTVSGDFVVAGQVTAANGKDKGISAGDVSAVGSINDDIIFTQEQTAAQVTITFTSSAAIPAGAGSVTIGGVTVVEGTDFDRVTESDGTLDVQATLDEIIGAFNRDNSNDFELNQLKIYREGLNIVVENKMIGDVFQADFATAATSVATGGGITNATVSTPDDFSNGQDTGVSVDAITNKDFIGTISGFNVTYEAEDQVTISITVGDRTYTAEGVNVAINNFTDLDDDLGGGAETFLADTTPAVRLKSEEGDYFDIDLMGARENLNVSDQDDADDLAGRLDSAVSGLTFYQDREIDNFTPIGGASASVRVESFENLVIGNVTVTQAINSTSDAIVEFQVGSEIFRSDDLGDDIRAGTTLRFVSTSDDQRYITYNHGETDFDLQTDAGVENFEEYLRTAFQVGADDAGANFQVGITTTDTIKISIGVATTTELFDGASINVLTQDAAAAASDVLDEAIDKITSIRADVGALQSRFDFAAANIESSLQNQDSARGVLLDTDIAAESTAFATAQVQLQAGISVLAQANLLQQNLLKLIG